MGRPQVRGGFDGCTHMEKLRKKSMTRQAYAIVDSDLVVVGRDAGPEAPNQV